MRTCIICHGRSRIDLAVRRRNPPRPVVGPARIAPPAISSRSKRLRLCCSCLCCFCNAHFFLWYFTHFFRDFWKRKCSNHKLFSHLYYTYPTGSWFFNVESTLKFWCRFSMLFWRPTILTLIWHWALKFQCQKFKNKIFLRFSMPKILTSKLPAG